MKLDWKKICYEEVLDYHPDRLADSLADYIGKELETKIENEFWQTKSMVPIKHYSIDIILARKTVNIYIEASFIKGAEGTKEYLKLAIKEIVVKFLYLQEGLVDCIKIPISKLAININIFYQSAQLFNKKENVSNDNCIINYYQSKKLEIIKHLFKKAKQTIYSYPNILKDGKMILEYNEKLKAWVCHCVLCFKGEKEEIIKTVEALEKYPSKQEPIIKVEGHTDGFWVAPCSFMSDIGVTGRKLQSDFFYGLAPHQQGSIHGKDLSKYDRYGYQKLKETFDDKDKLLIDDEIFVSETWISGKKTPLKTYICTNNSKDK